MTSSINFFVYQTLAAPHLDIVLANVSPDDEFSALHNGHPDVFAVHCVADYDLTRCDVLCQRGAETKHPRPHPRVLTLKAIQDVLTSRCQPLGTTKMALALLARLVRGDISSNRLRLQRPLIDPDQTEPVVFHIFARDAGGTQMTFTATPIYGERDALEGPCLPLMWSITRQPGGYTFFVLTMTLVSGDRFDVNNLVHEAAQEDLRYREGHGRDVDYLGGATTYKALSFALRHWWALHTAQAPPPAVVDLEQYRTFLVMVEGVRGR